MTPTASPARTLPRAVGQFVGFTSPRILLACLAAAVVLRIGVGDYRWGNLVWVAVVLAIQPFLEWVLHVFVLHARPRIVAGRTFDTVVARDHRAHHADPRDLSLVFIPLRWCGYLVASVVLVGLAVPDWSGRSSFYVAAFAMAVAYEWCHYLIHTDYKPRTALYRHLYANHRLHHYRNEKYWFGITNTTGDRVLGTAPAKDEVPVSPTARDLLGEGRGATRAAGR